MSFTTTNPWVQYAGNDSATEFALNHKIHAVGDVVVLLTVDATNVTTTQTITTHYTVDGVAEDAHDNTTPIITMVTPPATGETLTIYRDGSLIMDTSFLTTQFWQSLSAEEQNELFVMLMQWLKLILDRCIQGSLASDQVTITVEELLATTPLSDLSALVTKAVLVAADIILIGDSADSFSNKKATLTNLMTFIATLHYLKSEHINSSAGGADAGKPIKLDGAGQIALNMLKAATTSAKGIQENAIASEIDNNAASLTVTAAQLILSKYGGALEGNAHITIIGAGGAAITTGLTPARWEAPCAGTLNQATALLDQSGSLVVDVWKTTYSDYDAGSTHPVDGDSITSAAPITVSGATKSQDSTLSGWTKTFVKGDLFFFNVDSAATATSATLILDYDITGV